MGTETLGYPQMVPLGYAYVCQQDVLLASDPTGLKQGYLNPNDLRGSLAGPILAYAPDLARAVQATDDPAVANPNDPATREMIVGFLEVFLGQGPIPTDFETSDASRFVGEWGDADNVVKERYVHVYRRQDTSSQVQFGLDSSAALFMQVQGYSNSTGSWVLPRRFGGEQVFWWRYNGGNDWRTTTEYTGSWPGWSSVAVAVTWVMAAVVTIMSFGTLSAAAIGAAIGLTALEIAALGALLSAVANYGIVMLRAVATGDSRGYEDALAQIGNAALQSAVTVGGQAASDAMQGFAKANPALATFAATVASDVAKVKSAVAYATNNAATTTVDQYIQAATTNATALGIITPNYWKTVLGASGPVGGVIVNTIKNAQSVDEIRAITSVLPWYAEGFAKVGAAVRAADLAQDAALGNANRMVGRSVSTRTGKTPNKPTPLGTVVPKNQQTSSAAAPLAIAAGLGALWWLFFL